MDFRRLRNMQPISVLLCSTLECCHRRLPFRASSWRPIYIVWVSRLLPDGTVLEGVWSWHQMPLIVAAIKLVSWSFLWGSKFIKKLDGPFSLWGISLPDWYVRAIQPTPQQDILHRLYHTVSFTSCNKQCQKPIDFTTLSSCSCSNTHPTRLSLTSVWTIYFPLSCVSAKTNGVTSFFLTKSTAPRSTSSRSNCWGAPVLKLLLSGVESLFGTRRRYALQRYKK